MAPAVEQFESRQLLTGGLPITFFVNTLGDTIDANPNVTSLREAVLQANAQTGQDVIIQLMPGPGPHTLTINGANEEASATGDLDISSAVSVTIRGAADGTSVIDANFSSADRVFDIASGNFVTIEGVTIKDGQRDSGGAIDNAGQLTVVRTTFFNNRGDTGTDPVRGGAIHNAATGSLFVLASTFDNNTTTGEGGAIYNLGSAFIDATTFFSNDANGSGNNHGGAIYNASSGTLNVQRSTFELNTAGVGAGSGDGGAIFTAGSAGIDHSTFSANLADNGGAIEVASGGSLFLTASTVTQNTALLGGGVDFNGSSNAALVQNTIIAQNTATSNADFRDIRRGANAFTSLGFNLIGIGPSGAGFVNATNNDQVGTTAPIDAMLGALVFNGGPTKTHRPLVGSTAIDRGTLPNVIGSALPITDQRGAPLRAPIVADIGAVETGTNAVFVNTLNDTPDANLLDGVIADAAGNISLRAALHQRNVNSSIAPVIVVLPGVFLLDETGPNKEDAGATGDLDVNFATEIIGFGPLATIIDANGIDRVFDLRSFSTATLIESLTVQHGVAATDVGGGIRNVGRATLNNVHVRENQAASGGGIFSQFELNLDGVFIANNMAIGSVSVEGTGGGIANFGRATVRASIIAGNFAAAGAGGIDHIGSSNLFEIDSSTIRDNRTDGDAGGIVNEGRMIIRDSNITGNMAGLRAGGIGSVGDTTLIRSNVDGNVAGTDAGGVGAESGTLNISASRITFNTAGANGGGLGIIGSTIATVNYSAIARNRALSGAGGGVVVGSGSVQIGNSAIVNNVAGQTGISFGNGGGLYVTGGTTALSNSTVSGNTAIQFNSNGGAGGGVTQAGGALSVTHATITNNTAALGGGFATIAPPSGIFSFGPSFGSGTVQNTIIAKNMVGLTGTGRDVFASTNTVGSLGRNLIGVAGSGTGGPIFVDNVNNDRVGTVASPLDPLLGALALNGGLTRTHALQAGSPAIDTGGTTTSFSDQRGVPRVLNGGTSSTADIGAFEFGFNGFFVNTTDDTVDANIGNGVALDANGKTSLRAAIQESNALAGTQTIVLVAGVYKLTRFGPGEDLAATGDLDVTGSVNIRGYGAESTTIDGQQFDRLFDVSGGANLLMSDVTLTNGRVNGIQEKGGAIRSDQSHVELDRVTVTKNFANGFGGGIHAQGNLAATVIVRDSVFTNNTSADSGGAISVQNDSLVATNTRFEFNIANGIGIGRGGGALLIADSTANIQGSLFRNNTGTFGGAVYVDTFGQQTMKTVSVSDSEFSNNSGQIGGAIANVSQTLSVLDSVFSNNFATSGIGGGGGVHNFSGMVTISDSDFLGNQAFSGNGGAITNEGPGATLTLTASTLKSGFAFSGGGLHNAATANVFESTISENFGINGGGINNGGTLMIRNSTISANNASSQGGGLRNTTSGTATITNATFALNTASDGGGISNDSAAVAVTLQNTLVATNSTLGNSPNADLSGSFTSNAAGGNNLIGDLDGATGFTNGSNGDIVGGVTSVAITNATSTKPIQITTAVSHGLMTGDRVRVTGVGGLSVANGNFFVTVINETTFTLNDSFGSGNGTYTGGGQVFELVNPLLGVLRDNNLSRFAPPLAPIQFGNLPPVVTQTPRRSTFTHELLLGSPAIDAGTNTGTPTTDQRSFARTDGNNDTTVTRDIGAFELAHTTVSCLAFSDANGNGLLDVATEFRRADVTVFVDSNGNGQRDDFEPFANPQFFDNPSTPQDDFGNYTLELVRPGQQVIGHTIPFNTRPTAPNDPRLSSPSTVASGNTPRSVVTADFNNDSRLDFAYVDAGAGIHEVVINQRGQGMPVAGFIRQAISVGSMPVDVAAADLDFDGRVDLVVANFNSDTLTVLFNLGNDAFGNAQFGGAVTLPAGDEPTSLVIADLNGDLQPDIAVANRNSNDVLVFANTGSRTFAAGAGFGVSSTPRQMVAADFDGDGLTDLAVAVEGTNRVTFLFNFSTPAGFNFNSDTSVTFNASTLPRSLVAEDFDQDGDFDLVVGGATQLFQVANFGNRNFDTTPNVIAPFAASADLATVDIDGDGDKDVVAVSESAGIVGVFEFENGTLASSSSFPTGSAPTGIAVGEFSIGESYSRPDILTANSGGGTVTLLTNLLGSAVVTGVVGVPIMNQNFGVQPLATIRGNVFNDLDANGQKVGPFRTDAGFPNISLFLDTNGNGRFDSSFEPAALTIGPGLFDADPGDFEFRNLIPGTYRVIPLPRFNSIVTSPVIAPADSVLIDTQAGANAADILVDNVDVNLDGRKDLLVLRRIGGNSEFQVLHNNGSGFSPLMVSPIPLAGNALRLALGDFDGDGDNDVVITRDPDTNAGNGNGVLDFIRNETSFFSFVSSIPLNNLPTDIAVGNVDGGLGSDIVVSTLSSTLAVTILTRTGDFTFDSAMLNAGTEVRGIALADLDADDDLDLVATDAANNNFKVFGNDGTGVSNTAASTTSTVIQPGRVYVSDAAASSALDIVVTSRTVTTLTIHYGGGIGTLPFNAAGSLSQSVGGIVSELAVVDYDHDGLKDLVVANASGVISVLRGDANCTFLSPESLAITPPVGASNVMFDLGEFDSIGTEPFLDVATIYDFSGNAEVRLGFTRLNSYLVDVEAGQTSPPFNFGVVAAATLQGITFNDLDADGRQDPGEPPQPFVTVFVDRNNNGVLDQFDRATVSAMNGTYFLPGVRPQDDSIVRVLVDGTFAPTGPVNAQFSGAITLPGVGSQSTPSSDLIAVGNLDGDGDEDFVRANPNDDSISIFRLDQLTGTHARMDITVGDNPSAVLIGNVAGTVGADLFVLNRGSDTVSHFEFNGSGGFDLLTTLFAGNDPGTLSSFDFAGNGNLELAITSTADGSIRFYTANATTSVLEFAGMVSVTEASAGNDLSFGDFFDNDGDQDFALLDTANDRVVFVRNTGGGTVSFQQSVMVGDQPVALSRGFDIDGDGDKDLAVAIAGDGGKFQFLCNNNGTFVAETAIAVGGTPSDIEVGFIENTSGADSQADVVVTLSNANQIHIFEWNGATFSSPNFAFVSGPQDSLALGQVATGFGGGVLDGLEIVTSLPGTGAVSLSVNRSSDIPFTFLVNAVAGETVAGLNFGSIPAPGEIRGTKYDDLNENGFFDMGEPGIAGVTVFLDLDNDDVLDAGEPSTVTTSNGSYILPVANTVASYTVSEVVPTGYLQTGPRDLNFAPSSVSGAIGASALAAADLNGDGRVDLISPSETADFVSVFLRNADGSYGAPGLFAVGFSPSAVLAIDVNNNTHIDLVIANGDSNNVSVLINQGNGTFLAAVHYTVGTSPSDLRAGFFNSDSFLDLVTTNEGSNDVSILLNLGNGTGTFAVATNVPVGALSAPGGVAVGDFDNDTDLDLAVTRTGSGFNDVRILTNGGTGTFTAGAVIALAASPKPVRPIAADFNADGRVDLAVPGRFSENIAILLANPAGGFFSPSFFFVGTNPEFATAVDLDRNGTLDLAVSVTDDGKVAVLINDGAGNFTAPFTFLTGLTGPDAGQVVPLFLNADADPDLAVTSFADNSIVLLTNTFLSNRVFVNAAETVLNQNFGNVPDTQITLNGNDLRITDRFGSGSPDLITLATNGSEIIISSALPLVTNIANATGSGTNEVRVPINFSGKIIVDTRGGADTLTIDFSTGNFSREIQYIGGEPTSGPGDTLVLQGGTFDLAVFNANSVDAGSIMLTDNLPISYTGLEPVLANITIANLILNYTSASETIFVTNAGSGRTSVDSDFGEIVTFNNPTTSLTIESNAGNDTLVVQGLGANFGASLTLNSGDGSDFISVQEFGARVDASLTINAGAGDDTIRVEDVFNGSLTINSGDGDDSLAIQEFGERIDASLTINAGAGNDTIGITDVGDGLFASLTIDGQDGDDVLTLNSGDLLFGSAASSGDVTLVAESIALNVSRIATDGDTTNNDAGSVTFNGNVTLNANLLIDVDSTTASDGNVSFSGTIDGAQALTITAGSGTVTLGGEVGSTTPLSGLTVTSGSILLGGNVQTDGGDLTLSGNIVLTVTQTWDTERGNNGNAGSVNLGTSSVSASAASLDLTINTRASGFQEGDVSLATFNADGGQLVRHLTIQGSGSAGNPSNLTFAGAITLASGGNLIADSGSITLSTAAADIVLSGNGGAELSADRSIVLVAGSSIQTAGGNVTLAANGSATPTSGNFTGILLDGATVTTTGAGIIFLDGRSGNASNLQYGILLQNSSLIQATGSGVIALSGVSRGTSGPENDGILIASSSDILATTGSINLKGVGGVGSTSEGISLTNSAVTIATTNAPIFFRADVIHIGSTQPSLTAGNGNSIVLNPFTPGTAIGLGEASSTVFSLSDAQLDRMTAGTIDIGDANSGEITVSAAITRSTATNLTLNAGGNSSLLFSGAGSLDANGGLVFVRLNAAGSGGVVSGTAATDILASVLSITAGSAGIGASGNPLALSVATLTTDTNDATDAAQFLSELDSLTVESSDLDAGTAAITLAGGLFVTDPNGSILSSVTIASGATLGGTGTTGAVTVQSGGRVSPGTSPGILNTGNVSFSSGSTFSVEVNGTTAGTQHDQLNVTGTVSLGGATLSASGTITSVPSQSIVLINNDGTDAVSGTFNGLADGATVTINGINFFLSYYGGSNGNDVTLTQAGGALSFNDDDGAADTFTIRLIGSTVQILNGSTIVGSTPAAATAGITINGEDNQNDSFVLDFTSGSMLPSGGITFHGGAAGQDDLTLTSGTFNSINHNFTNANDGSVAINGSTAVNYTGLEPITDNLNAIDRVFSFNGGAETITLTDGTANDGLMTIDSDLSESVSFTNPTGSLTINAGTGNDVVTITSVDTTFDQALTINGDGGNDIVNLNADISFAAGENLNVDLTNDAGATDVDRIAVGANANLSLLGTGNINLRASGNVSLAAGSSLTTVNGDIALSANQQATSAAGNFDGVRLDAATVQSTGTATVTILGRGGDGTVTTFGVAIVNGGKVLGGTSGLLDVNGQGGAVMRNNNFGVVVSGASSQISSSGSAVHVTGTGGGSGLQAFNHGVNVEIGGQITAGGMGTVTVTGIGGAATQNFNIGVRVSGSASKITSSGGDVQVTGTGGGFDNSFANSGVSVENGGQITAGGTGTVAVTGIGGVGPIGSHFGVKVTGSGSSITSGGGVVQITGTGGAGASLAVNVESSGAITTATNGGHLSIIADSMGFDGTSAISANGASTVTLQQKTNGTAIDLGGADAAGILGLTDAELDRITAGTLRIGSANAGNISISAAINTANTNVLHLVTGGGVTQSAAITEGSLAVEAVTGITLDNAGNDVGEFAAHATGGSGAGVLLIDSNGFMVTTVDSVAGVDSETGNVGLVATTGNITVVNTSAANDVEALGAINITLNGDDAIFTIESGADLETSGGIPNISADKMDLDGTITAPLGIFLFATKAGELINLGSTTDAASNTLELSDAELDNMVTGLLRLGSTSAGALSITAAIDTANTNVTSLITNSTVTQTAAITEGQLAIRAGGAVTLTSMNDVDTLGITTPTGNVTFTDSDGFVVGAVHGVGGINTDNGGVTLLSSSGNVTISNTGVANDIDATAAVSITLSGDEAQLTIAAGADVESTGGSHTYTADKIDLAGTITATGQSVTLRNASSAEAINLGSATDSAANTLELSDAELDRVAASTIQIGDSNSGTMTVSAAITRAAATKLSLTTNNATINAHKIEFTGGSLDPNGGNVTLNTYNIAADASGTDIFANQLSLTARTGGIGSASNPLRFAATTLFSNTGSGNGPQFLHEADSVSVLSGWDADGGAITLASGTFQYSTNDILRTGHLTVKSKAILDLNNFSEPSSGGGLTLESGAASGASIVTGTGTLTIQGNVTLNATGGGAVGATVSGNLNLGGAVGATGDGATRTFNVGNGTAASDLTIASVVSNGGVTKSGAGTLTLGGANNYSGTTTVSGGLLNINGSITSNTTVASGGMLGGTGTINSGNTLTVQNGGTVAPGTSPGILNTGDVAFQLGSTFAVEIGGTTPGNAANNYDQLNVTGTVTIGANVTLNPTLGFTPVAGDTFVIINNDGADAVTRTFNGLSQGALLSIGSDKFHIFYNHIGGVDGNANDVALIANRLPVVKDQMFSIAENNGPGTVVGSVVATDADSPVTFAITGGNTNNVFAINQHTGQITVNNASALDFERNPVFNLTVAVTDDASATDTATVTIDVTNVAPSTPVDANQAPNQVSERDLNGTPVGITASSNDIHGGTVTYTFNIPADSANGRFAVEPLTGIVTLADATRINPVTTYSITVRASDGTGTSRQTFTIAAFFETPDTPVDVDTQAGQTNTISESAPPGNRVGVTAFAFDHQHDDVFYVLTDDAGGRFAIDSQTGVVTVKKTSLLDRPTNPAQHTIRARAIDAKGNATSDVPFLINVTEVPDNSPPVVSILPTRVDVVEGNSGLNFVTFIAKLSKTSTQTVTIDFTTRRGDEPTFQLPKGIGLNAVFASDGTRATTNPVVADPLGPRDFFRSSGRLTFDPGVDEQIVAVQIRPDTLVEPNEFFFVQLSLPVDRPLQPRVDANATLSPQQSVAIARILDDDATPQLIISNAEVLEGDTPNQNQLVFRVELVGKLLLDSNLQPLPTTVDFATGNPLIDTAIAGTDYTAVTGSRTFTDSDRVKFISVNILGDISNEADETVSLRFENAMNLGLPRSAVTGTIRNDDDNRVVLSITPVPVDLTAVVEGDAGTQQPMTFTVTLGGKTTNVVTVNYQTVDVSTTAGVDYTATRGTLTFQPGEVTQTITVMVSGDADVEEDEAFQIVLSLPDSPTQPNVSIDSDLALSTIVIRNDDQAILTENGNDLTDQLNLTFDNNNGVKSAAMVAALVQQALAFIAANGLTNYILIVIDPVDFILTDPQNRSSGFTESTGIVNQIPGAFYSGDGNVEVLVVPLPPAGTYNVQLVGIGGDFHGSITVVEGSQSTTTTVSQALNGDLATVAVQVGNNANSAITVGLGLAAANAGNAAAVGVVGAFGQLDFNSLVAQLFQNLPLGFLDELNPPQTLTEEEIQERAANLLKKLDKNKDNVITADEVEEEDWKTLLQSDKDGDGRITLEELQDQIRANAVSKPKSPTPGANGPRTPQQNPPKNPQGNPERTKAKPTTFERNRSTPNKTDKSSQPPAQPDAGKGQGKTTQNARPGSDDSRQANASRPWWHLFLPWSEKNSTNSRDTRNV